MFVRAKHAWWAVIQASCFAALAQSASLLVECHEVIRRAVWTDELLNETLADILGNMHALSVKPVFTRLAANHPAVVVRSSTEAVGPVIRLVVFIGCILCRGTVGFRRLCRFWLFRLPH